MDVTLIEKILFLSSIKNGIFDYSILDKSILDKFCKENNESSPLLLEYIIYKIINYKLQNNITINPNIIIVSEEYIKNNEKIIDTQNNESLPQKIFLVPYFDESSNNWWLIILYDLFNESKETNVKIISAEKNNNNINKEDIINNIIKKMNTNLENSEKKNIIESFNINKTINSSKFLINFINNLIEEKDNNMDDYITNVFNKNQEEENNIIDTLCANNDLFKNLIEDYEIELNGLSSNNEKKETNKNIQTNAEVKELGIIKVNDKIEEEENIESQKNIELANNEEDENNDENLQNEDYNLDELAKKIVNNIMNINMNKKEEPKNIKEIIKKNNKVENINENDLEDGFNGYEYENVNNLKINEINEEEADEKNDLDDIFDLNFNHEIDDDKYENKKIDDSTKNTIDDILASVLNDMEKDKNKYKTKKIKKKGNKFRPKTFNINQKIDIIEEEDKESSTSEIHKEIKIDNINTKKEDEKNKDELLNNSKISKETEIERRPSIFSYNQENYDDTKIKEGEIDCEEQEIFIKKEDKNINVIALNNDNNNIIINNNNKENECKNNKNEEEEGKKKKK